MAKGKRVMPGQLDPAIVAKIRADIAEWRPGRWAEEIAYRPACRCGKRRTPWVAEGGGIDDGTCPRHPVGVLQVLPEAGAD